MLIFLGIPLFYMELALAQYCSSGPLTCWQFAPIVKGEQTDSPSFDFVKTTVILAVLW